MNSSAWVRFRKQLLRNAYSFDLQWEKMSALVLNVEFTLLARIFHTPERRLRARGLQERRYVLVGRVPSRGALLAFPSGCEISGLALEGALDEFLTHAPRDADNR